MIDPFRPDYSNTPADPRRPAFGYCRAGPGVHGPQVSVITPFHNARPIFRDTAACVLGQSLQAFEWIIVNDASTDAESLRMLAARRDGDDRIRVIDNPANLGLAATRNAGAAAARAPLLFFLDDDDLIEPTTLEKLCWFLHSNPQHAFASARVVGFGGQEYLWLHGFHRGADFLAENFSTAMTMVRKTVHDEVGGFDASMRGGLEDWDYWLRCAARGHWGATIPDYLLWYRRRAEAAARWSNMNGDNWVARFRAQLATRYPHLTATTFPKPEARYHPPLAPIRTTPPLDNPLARSGRRLLLITPWMTLGGADRFNLDLLEQLGRAGWRATVVSTLPHENQWAPAFARHTPDIFALHDFLDPRDHPVFLRYLVESRRPDVVMVTNSELGYLLLPYLRTQCPEPRYVDYSHMEEEYWRSGGHPRYAAAMQDLLDRNMVASSHLRDWMVHRGAAPDRIEVVTINVDPQRWRPDADARDRVRRELSIDPHTPIILFPARLSEQKQPRVFAEVMAMLAQQRVAFAALAAGDGPDRAWLTDFAVRRRLGARLRVLGPRSPEQMHELMPACDVLFLPSLWEGIALSIYEAMACGLAVVATDVGGQRELVTPDCGVLLPPPTTLDPGVERFCSALTRVLGDHAARAAMGRAARERILSAFTLDAMGQRVASIFERLLAAAPAPHVALTPRLANEMALQALETIRNQQLADYYRAHAAERDDEARKLRAGLTGFAYRVGRKILDRVRRR